MVVPLRVVLLAVALTAVLAAPARAGYIPGQETPGACSGDAFADGVGTLGIDLLAGTVVPQRLYGLTGNDVMGGSHSRATCLFGGQGDDLLVIGRGGGLAFGEDGADMLRGSALDDGLSGGDGTDLVAGGEGRDVLRAGKGVDGLDGGPGDDLLDAADGRAEIVDCGAGEDTAIADGLDVVVGCERGQQIGERLPVRRLRRRAARRTATVRLRFRVPEAAGPGGYRVLLAGHCDSALREVAAWGAVRGRQRTRVLLRPPTGRWCPGSYGGAIVRAPECPSGRTCWFPRPFEPLALVVFRVR